MMNRVLVFKTSGDSTIMRLFSEINKCEIDCLIQSHDIERYKVLYPEINFIDIQAEGFYDLLPDIIRLISKKYYNEVFITVTGMHGYNYENVLDILRKCNFNAAFFYNCNGKRTVIPVFNSLYNWLLSCYIGFVQSTYRLLRD